MLSFNGNVLLPPAPVEDEEVPVLELSRVLRGLLEDEAASRYQHLQTLVLALGVAVLGVLINYTPCYATSIFQLQDMQYKGYIPLTLSFFLLSKTRSTSDLICSLASSLWSESRKTQYLVAPCKKS